MSPEPDALGRAYLELASAEDGSRSFALAGGAATFGRVAGNTHVLADATISRQHAKVFVRDGRHWIADQNSTHGTFVNGVKITLQTLVDGDEVRLGTTTLRYRLPGAAARAPSPPAASDVPRGAPVPDANAPAPAAKPVPATPPEPPTGSFELEFGEGGAQGGVAPIAGTPGSGAPPQGATKKPFAPPPAPRSGLTARGEDPFSDAAAAPEAGEAPASTGAAAPQFELRGATARALGTRGGAPAGAAAASSPQRAKPGQHLPPPIARPPRSQGTFSFLGDDLDQRGGGARFVAIVFALAAAGALGWLALSAFDLLPKGESTAPLDEEPAAPLRPVLPQR